MVIMIQKPYRKNFYVVFVLKQTFDDFWERHCNRSDLHRGEQTTCLVDTPLDWLGKPSYATALNVLIDTIQKQAIQAGERNYPIPALSVQCRPFDEDDTPTTTVPVPAALRIRLQSIHGRARKALLEIEAWAKAAKETVTAEEKAAIELLFSTTYGKYEKEFVFMAHHIYPVPGA